jgi:hypothetical protein
MTTRRQLVALSALGGLAAVARPAWPSAGSSAQAEATLETWLFNMNDAVSPERTEELMAAFRARARSLQPQSFLLGPNFIPDPFVTRFEWLCMVQFDDADRSGRAREGLAQAREELAGAWRNAVRCELQRPLAARYADATGIKVRHTVMFNFKPEASADARARNVDAIRAMGRLPMVQAYLVDRNPHFANAPDQMEWQVIGDFASVGDYRAYSRDPAHLALKDDFAAHTARVAFLDVQP